MKKTLIALTALVAATVGFQGQAQAESRHYNGSSLQFDVQLGNGFGIRIADRKSQKRNRRHVERYGYKKHHRYQERYGYNRRHRCYRAGKRSIRRSLRHRGYYDIHRVRRYGRIFSAKAVSPRGHLVKLKINGCNHRIIKRRVIHAYPTVWSNGYSQRTYW